MGATVWVLAYGAGVGLWALARWEAFTGPGAPPPPQEEGAAGVLLASVAALLVMLLRRRWRAPAVPPTACWAASPAPAGRWDDGHRRAARAALWGWLATAVPATVAPAAMAAAAGWMAAEASARAAWRPAPWETAGPVTVRGRVASVPENGPGGPVGGAAAGLEPPPAAPGEGPGGPAPEGRFLLAVESIAGRPVATRVRVRWRAGREATGTGAAAVGAPPATTGAPPAAGASRAAAGHGGSLAPSPAGGLTPLASSPAAGHGTGAGRWGYGDRVEVTGTLRRLRPATNPGGYDALAGGLQEGVAYELVAGGAPRRLAPAGPGSRPARAVLALRERLREGLAASLPPGPRGVAAALLLDWREELSATARDALAATGLIHLLAVSGQHVAMAAAVAGWLAVRAGWLPGRRRVAVGGLVVLYAALTGGPPSVLRAAATYLLAEVGRAMGRPVSAVAVLVWAGAAQAFLRPLVLLDPSFQLSFAATAGLVVLFPSLRRAWRARRAAWAADPLPGGPARRPGRWKAWGGRALDWAGDGLALTAAAQLAVLPVQVALFGRVPLVALVANLVAVPLSGLALAGGAVAAVAGAGAQAAPPWAGAVPEEVARWLGWPARLAISGMVGVAMLADRLPGSSVSLSPAAAGWVAAGAGWLLCCLGDGRPGYARRLRPRPLPAARRLAPALLAGLAAVAATRLAGGPPPPGRFVAWFLDVGQGDAAVLRFPGGRSLQVDAGGRAVAADPARYWPGPVPAVPDAVGEGVTVPVVRRLLGGPPDVLAITHADRDHAGGAGAVLERLGARTLWLGGVPGAPLDRALAAVAARRGVPLVRPVTGWAWQPAPGCRVDVLHPPATPPGSGSTAEGTGAGRAPENNASLVLRAGCGGARVLLVGDLEKEGENQLLARGADVRAEVLKVSHHGSRGATQPAFLAAVRPVVAIVSVGSNPYGLPHVETLARLRRAGVRVLRTDRVGAVRITLGPGSLLEVATTLPAPSPPESGS